MDIKLYETIAMRRKVSEAGKALEIEHFAFQRLAFRTSKYPSHRDALEDQKVKITGTDSQKLKNQTRRQRK
eukprot:4288564-Amphidinium_carterae.1